MLAIHKLSLVEQQIKTNTFYRFQCHYPLITYLTCKIAQPIEPITQYVLFLPCLHLPSKSQHLNLFHIFAICLSSRHEKRYQVLEKLLLVFLHTINIPSNFSLIFKTETEKAELSTP